MGGCSASLPDSTRRRRIEERCSRLAPYRDERARLKNEEACIHGLRFDARACGILATNKTIQTFVNGKLIAEYEEPDGKTGALEVIDTGTFALQAHDPRSTTYYKNLKVKPLD